MHGRETAGRIARATAWTAVKLRWPLLIGWTAAAIAAGVLLPALGTGGQSSPLGDILPASSEALRTEQRALERFGSSVATDTVVVQRNPGGLTRAEIEAHARGANAVAGRRQPDELRGIRAAVPLVNLPLGGLPWQERNTTALTYLFMGEDLNLLERDRTVERYEETYLAPAPGSAVGVTGAGPARLAQFEILEDKMLLIEGATIAVIVLITAIYFRSLGAPLVTLFVAALAYVLAIRGLGWFGEQADVSVPGEIEPILTVLLLGLVTDYSVFFLSEARRRLLRGESRLEAAQRASARMIPIVFTAGVIVAAGCASLLAGELEFFRVFGPGLAASALVVTLVCVTLLPAVLGIAGARLFGQRVRDAEGVVADAPPAARPAAPAAAPAGRGRWRTRFAGTRGALRAARRHARAEGGSAIGATGARVLAARPVSTLIVIGCIAALAVAALGIRDTSLAASFVGGLPPESEPRRAADQAALGFVPGILAPTDIVLEGAALGARQAELGRLQEEIARRPGVALVLGPREAAATLRTRRFALSDDGAAARLVAVLEDEAGGADAIRTVQDLEDDLPLLLSEAGLGDARASLGGETALAAETVDAIKSDLRRIAVATLAITFVLLAMFLRALVAPLLLLFASVLAFAAALGLAALVIPGWLGSPELTYYVPLVGAVLLIALGSDYNVFIAGRIREEAARRRLREAIAVAAPSASRAITVAGITLAATFALLALVPLRAFRELALLMAIGVLLDALVVRPMLIPALISVVGRRSWWPGRAQSPVPADEFLAGVAARIGLGTAEARRVTEATFATLGERLTNTQARELAAQLPAEVSGPLTASDGSEPFSFEEFAQRVAAREGTSAGTAREDAAAVMATVAETIPQTELDYVRANLSADYRPLLGDAAMPAKPAPGDGSRPAAIARP